MATYAFKWFGYADGDTADIAHDVLSLNVDEDIPEDVVFEIAKALRSFEFGMHLGYDTETENITVLACR